MKNAGWRYHGLAMRDKPNMFLPQKCRSLYGI
jgi:hypothetical protein